MCIHCTPLAQRASIQQGGRSCRLNELRGGAGNGAMHSTGHYQARSHPVHMSSRANQRFRGSFFPRAACQRRTAIGSTATVRGRTSPGGGCWGRTCGYRSGGTWTDTPENHPPTPTPTPAGSRPREWPATQVPRGVRNRDRRDGARRRSPTPPGWCDAGTSSTSSARLAAVLCIFLTLTSSFGVDPPA